MFTGRNISSEKLLFCQTRSINENEYSVEVVAAKPLEIWWNGWDRSSSHVQTPLLLSCPLTEPLSGPSVISIVTEPCDDPSNGFYIEKMRPYNRYKRTFTICVKDLTFQKDISQNLIEWIETNKLLGADMIDMYIDDLSQEDEDVLLTYRSQGYVRLFQVPIRYKSNRSLWQRRRDHILTYNDCLYRNIIESKYIVPLDVDEVLLPKIAYTWSGLLKRLEFQGWDSNQYAAILVQNVFFFSFMQEIQNYKTSDHTHESKIYIKRDDVRIETEENLVLQEIEIVPDTSSNMYNLNDEYDYSQKKSDCDKDVPMPKLASHIVSSAVISPTGHYSKSFMLTKRVLTAFNHYPLASLGTAGISGWSAPFNEVQLNHYKVKSHKHVINTLYYN